MIPLSKFKLDHSLPKAHDMNIMRGCKSLASSTAKSRWCQMPVICTDVQPYRFRKWWDIQHISLPALNVNALCVICPTSLANTRRISANVIGQLPANKRAASNFS